MRFVALLVAALATAASAATSPEFAVASPHPAEAPFDQTEPSVASNGKDYFAVWRDTRSSTDTRTAVTLYGSRIGIDGKFVQPYGVPIESNVYRGAVASTGQGYLIVDSKYTGGTFARHVSDDGLIDAAPSAIETPSYIYSLTSNGSGFLALMSDAAANTFTVIFLDANGVPLATTDIGSLHDPVVVAAGSDYRIVDLEWTCDGHSDCVVVTRLTSIDNKRHIVSGTQLGPRVSQASRLNAIATDRLFTVTTDYIPSDGRLRSMSIEVTDFDGHVIAPPRVIATTRPTSSMGSWKPSLATDGTQVLVAWPREHFGSQGAIDDSTIVGVRIRPDGTSVDIDAAEITGAHATLFVAARSAAGVLLLSSEQHHSVWPYEFGAYDLFSRSVRSLAEVTALRAEAAMVESAAGQFEPAVSTYGSRAIVVWRELDQPSEIRASSFNVANPAVLSSTTLAARSSIPRNGLSVAAFGGEALAVWNEITNGDFQILALPLGMDGIVHADSPIVIASQYTRNAGPATTSIATDGTQFLVVWNTDLNVFAVRVHLDGTVIDHAPILVSFEKAPDWGFPLNPRVVWTGTTFLVVWADDPWPPGIYSPSFPPQTIVRTARVSSSGAVLDSIESPILVNKPGPIANVSLAVNRDTVMAVWSGSDDNAPATLSQCVHALPLDRDGRPRSAPVQVACETFVNSSDTLPDPAIAAKDDSFVIFWSSSSQRNVRGRSLTVNALAGPTFEVTPTSSDTWRPAAASSTEGTIVTYSRIATEPEYGGSPRVFGRVIGAVPPPQPKQRAVKH